MTTGWVVTLDYDLALTESEYGVLADRLDRIEVGLFNLPGGMASATYWTDAPDPVKAASVAREHLADYVDARPMAIHVVTAAAYEAQSAAPTLPPLVSAPEAAEILGGISRQRVHQLRSNPHFPAPLFELRTGPVWDARAIEKFAREWDRKPGRPAGKAAAGHP